MFYIDNQNNFLRNIAPFDREAQMFDTYLVPQIQIKLNLDCGSSNDLITLPINISMSSETLETDEILYSRTVTHLNIIIVDQNDNSPIFTNPSMSGSVIGQPDADLTERLMPHYLIDIESFDKDEGLNAKIRYSLLSYEHFTIDPELGIVSPLKNCMLNEIVVTLDVVATDRDGAVDGNSATTSITVLKVKAENVVVISLENEDLENVPKILNELSQSLDIDVRTVNYFAVPAVDNVEARQIKLESKIMIYAYAFKANELMLANDVTETLSTSEIDAILSYTTFDESNVAAKDCNITGLVVAVSVLGSLLVIIFLTAPFIWMFWLRHRFSPSENRRFSDTSSKKFEDDYGEYGRSSPPVVMASSVNYFESDGRPQSISEETRSDADIIGIQIDGATRGKINLKQC